MVDDNKSSRGQAGKMADKAEKRIQQRFFLDDSFTLSYQGESCRVVDVSAAGLGISYISERDWPEKITLEYSPAPEPDLKKAVLCRTVWESTMSFYRTRGKEVVRRRGLEFIEKGCEDVNDLHRHLKSLAQADQ